MTGIICAVLNVMKSVKLGLIFIVALYFILCEMISETMVTCEIWISSAKLHYKKMMHHLLIVFGSIYTFSHT